MSDAIPTVIVSRRVRPGAEQDFRRWHDRVRAAASEFEGHIGSELQPPSDAHPDEWVTIYRFASARELEAWLNSPVRAALIADSMDLLEGPVREQRLMEPAAAGAVTAVMSQRIRADAEDDFRRIYAQLSSEMSSFEGFLRSDLLEPVPGVQDEHVIVFSFASKQDLDRWLDSDERQRLVDDLMPLVEGDRTLSVVGGFAGWFPTSGAPQPVRWKQAVVVLIALYPTTLTLGLLQRWLLPDAHWALALFASNVLGIAILTWILMPRLTRWLSSWLRR